MTEALIKGWCPGALRPMRSGDGLIVRLRITGGIVGVELAEQIARWSRRWGNGQIDLTNRANLQLRGLSEGHLADLHDAMAEWDLLETSAAGEAVCNVVFSPLSGLDPGAVLDIRPIVRALERRLATDTVLYDLPAKFGFAIDDGGSFGLAGVPADIRFEAQPGVEGPEFAISLGGAAEDWTCRCRPNDLVDSAAALSRTFLTSSRSRESSIRRMRDLVAERGAEAICREVGLALVGSSGPEPGDLAPNAVILGLDPRISRGTHPTKVTIACAATDARVKPEHDERGDGHREWETERNKQVNRRDERETERAKWGNDHDERKTYRDECLIVILGLDPRISRGTDPSKVPIERAATDARVKPEHDDKKQPEDHQKKKTAQGGPDAQDTSGEAIIVGVGLPFGRITADDLAALALAAAGGGAPNLRLTPWRAILVPVPSFDAASAMCANLAGRHFILDPDDPRRRVAACPGSPSCVHATTPVRDDASKLAAALTGAPGTSIHVSGCAKGCAHPRPAALTLVGRDGSYDLVVDGLASSPPILQNLTLDQVLQQLPSIVADPT